MVIKITDSVYHSLVWLSKGYQAQSQHGLMIASEKNISLYSSIYNQVSSVLVKNAIKGTNIKTFQNTDLTLEFPLGACRMSYQT